MEITKFLGKKIFENNFILGTVIFEIFEMVMARNTPLFKENPKDTFTDISLNFSGYWLGQGGF